MNTLSLPGMGKAITARIPNEWGRYCFHKCVCLQGGGFTPSPSHNNSIHWSHVLSRGYLSAWSHVLSQESPPHSVSYGGTPDRGVPQPAARSGTPSLSGLKWGTPPPPKETERQSYRIPQTTHRAIHKANGRWTVQCSGGEGVKANPFTATYHDGTWRETFFIPLPLDS